MTAVTALPARVDTAINARGLVKIYGDRRVVDGLDLQVRLGECFALLGPNGAGKTTTVEILEGFRTRDGGEIDVLGVDPARSTRGWRARIGVVAQSDLGGFDLSVREAIAHFARYHADPHPNEQLIELVGLTDQAKVRIPALSGGQRRRLDVALGVQGRPDLLFLDEPTTGFDPAARRQFWALINDLKADGVTIVLTTHYLDEAAQLADRVGVIVAGRLVQVAPPQELGGRLSLGATVSWTADEHRHEVVTNAPTELLRQLMAAQPTGELADLAVVRPSLEDVYLALLDSEEPR